MALASLTTHLQLGVGSDFAKHVNILKLEDLNNEL